MKIDFVQIYVKVGVNYPYSFQFQQWLCKEVSERVEASADFSKKYGADFLLTFNISAKAKLDSFEIKGPTLFRQDKDVEYTIFLPFFADLANSIEGCGEVLRVLLSAVVSVLEACKLDPSRIEADTELLVSEFLSLPDMLRKPKPWDHPNKAPQ